MDSRGGRLAEPASASHPDMRHMAEPVDDDAERAAVVTACNLSGTGRLWRCAGTALAMCWDGTGARRPSGDRGKRREREM